MVGSSFTTVYVDDCLLPRVPHHAPYRTVLVASASLTPPPASCVYLALGMNIYPHIRASKKGKDWDTMRVYLSMLCTLLLYLYPLRLLRLPCRTRLRCCTYYSWVSFLFQQYTNNTYVATVSARSSDSR